MKFKAVIFDLFGTLVEDFMSSAGQMHAEMTAALGIPYDEFIRLWNQTLEMRIVGDFQTVEASIEYVCHAVDLHVEADQMQQAVHIRLKYIKQALKPRPEALATIMQLKNNGYKIGLISNCSIEIPILWQETSFANVIDTPIFSSRARLRKPDVRIYHLACERLDVLPIDCLYVADGEDHELAGAAKVGLFPVLIRTAAHETTKRLHQEAREWQGITIASLTDMLEVVKRRQLRDKAYEKQ